MRPLFILFQDWRCMQVQCTYILHTYLFYVSFLCSFDTFPMVSYNSPMHAGYEYKQQSYGDC